jgi:ubiquinone/menaquinone biosynthesis C-methylase UbiE
MSSRMSDQQYLLGEQYQDATKLRARVQLHERFSTNQYGWMPWVFDILASSAGGRMLELGCGTGALWAENVDRLPRDWKVVLSDLSPGMVEEARRVLRHSGKTCEFLLADVQTLPFADERFDGVIANHMLYHVPEVGKALSEARRVLKPGGRLLAATNGQKHMAELREMMIEFDPNVAFGAEGYSFSLENGAGLLAPWFDQIQVHRYEDSLLVTEAGPLLAYVLSSIGNAESLLVGERLEELTDMVEEKLARHGAMHITKESGLFVARRGNRSSQSCGVDGV